MLLSPTQSMDGQANEESIIPDMDLVVASMRIESHRDQ